ncbi:hypothetical protein SteCoe_3023 [Stentor coeruleus]|uniref:Protein kinase domain-containing protein n=1 Tax=Stentor coeruleus TaxID=5963 RepID=A0A1R2CYA1_9CILI|nr:hypothetical protein SteCoe_3023 [Stentor coeruleus]
MLDSDQDFFLIVDKKLKTSSIIKALPQLCANGTANELDYILKCIYESENKKCKAFARAILLLKLDTEIILGNSFIKYFNEVKQLLTDYPKYEQHITYYFDFILHKQIIACQKNDFLSLVEQAYLLKLPGDSISIQEIQKILNEILWKKTKKLSKSSSSSKALSIIFLILHAEKYNHNLNDIKNTIGSLLLDYIEERNGFIFNDTTTEHNIEEDQKILTLLAQFNIKDKIFNENLAYIKGKVDNLIAENNNKSGIMHLKDNLELTYIKENIYLDESQCLAIEENKCFRMKLYKAQYDSCPVYVKMYMPLDSNEDVSVIYNEVKYYQLLSSKTNENFGFLKFYGIFLEAERIFLVMEYQKYNLMDYITTMQMKKERVDDNLYTTIALKLLSTFAEMAALGIHHGNMLPHNMLIDEWLNIKIFDLSCSVIKVEKYLCSSDCERHALQDRNGYSAPEFNSNIIKNKTKLSIEKADVFSVGMILYQLYTLKHTGNLNQVQTNPFLIQEVKKIRYLHISKLLQNMLNADPEKREKFCNLLAYIDNNYDTLTLE